jgi:ribosomal protein S18 acetylase RimI-like enzyme
MASGPDVTAVTGGRWPAVGYVAVAMPGFAYASPMPPALDAERVRILLRHEALVHAIPGRVLLDLEDSLLLHDPTDAEPFWNRLEAVRWPADPAAFDRRLVEVLARFVALGRQPHVWVTPAADEPADLAERLAANGFETMGLGHLMAAWAPALDRAALVSPARPEVRVERLGAGDAEAARSAAPVIVGVLMAAFGVEEERRAGVTTETLASLADPRFTHYLVTRHGTPLAAARRATFDGISYLSSIGVVPSGRGLGLGSLVTTTAMIDAIDAGSEWLHLGVFADNLVAKRLYERLGFVDGSRPSPDMLLVG